MMEAKGFLRHGGPTGVMLSEHEEGRGHIRAMRAALSGAAAGRSPDLEQFINHAHGYIELLRQHIFKEDHRLFPMANQVFSQEEQARLIDQFNRVEHHDVEQGAHEKYLAVADRLAERFHVPIAARSCCSCHLPPVQTLGIARNN